MSIRGSTGRGAERARRDVDDARAGPGGADRAPRRRDRADRGGARRLGEVAGRRCRARRPGREAARRRRRARFYTRTLAETAVDLNGIHAGEPALIKTIVPAFCEATLSIRLAAGQDPDAIAEACGRCRGGRRRQAPSSTSPSSAVPASMTDPASPGPLLALEAFERALGQRPVLTRSGGTVPIRTALSARSRSSTPASTCPAGTPTRRTSGSTFPTSASAYEAAEALIAFGRL